MAISNDGRIQILHQLHAAPQKFRVGNATFFPSLQDAVDDDPFVAAKLAVSEVGVVDRLGDQQRLFIADSEARRRFS